ncbi:SDR family oxidoreductase [Amycolatopsis sp. NPDC051372]|uniref:SDR family oxidoreductase n=1 Tax=Amycolatopsis sp. NPDC051372 TaxID=3155669 RepID=UPI00343F538D
MTETQQGSGAVAVVAGSGSLVTSALAGRLQQAGWTVAHDVGTARGEQPIAALVYAPDLFSGDDEVHTGSVIDDLTSLVDRALPRMRSREGGGAKIVVVTSRDGLGWPNRPRTAATSAALVAFARSLALQLGPRGITVNVVASLPVEGSALHGADGPAGSHLREPQPLLPQPVTAEDIAHTTAFFLDDRSGYITGQVLYCCGGASLLSSLSV